MEILKRRRDRFICSIFGKEVVHGADILTLIKKCGDELIFVIIVACLCAVILCIIGFIIFGLTGIAMLIVYPNVSSTDPQIIVAINDVLMSGNKITISLFPIVGLIGSIIGAMLYGIVYCLYKSIRMVINKFSEFKLAEYHRKP